MFHFLAQRTDLVLPVIRVVLELKIVSSERRDNIGHSLRDNVSVMNDKSEKFAKKEKENTKT